MTEVEVHLGTIASVGIDEGTLVVKFEEGGLMATGVPDWYEAMEPDAREGWKQVEGGVYWAGIDQTLRLPPVKVDEEKFKKATEELFWDGLTRKALQDALVPWEGDDVTSFRKLVEGQVLRFRAGAQGIQVVDGTVPDQLHLSSLPLVVEKVAEQLEGIGLAFVSLEMGKKLGEIEGVVPCRIPDRDLFFIGPKATETDRDQMRRVVVRHGFPYARGFLPKLKTNGEAPKRVEASEVTEEDLDMSEYKVVGSFGGPPIKKAIKERTWTDADLEALSPEDRKIYEDRKDVKFDEDGLRRVEAAEVQKAHDSYRAHEERGGPGPYVKDNDDD